MTIAGYLRLSGKEQTRMAIKAIRKHVHEDWQPGCNALVLRDLELLCQFLLCVHELVQAKRQHFGSNSIIEVLRYQSEVADSDVQFKVNNNSSPYLSRTALALFPEELNTFTDRPFFELRYPHDHKPTDGKI